MVEILVGVAISLIGMIVMFQAMQNWEGRKRTTSSGSDAQVSGSIAIYHVERDIKMAGHGFGGAPEMGCTVKGFDGQRDSGAGAVIPDFGMIPVLITHGASGASDTVSVLYGDGTTVSAGWVFTASSATTKVTNNADGLKPGDLFIAADTAGNCGLFETTSNPPGIGAIVSHAVGNYTNSLGAAVAARYNNGSAMSIGVGLGGAIYNLGITPRMNVWQVTNGRLTVTNLLNNEVASDIAEGVVNFQAQYGFDQDNDGIIAETVNAGGLPEWVDTTPTTPAEWLRVRAVRVALLVRSQQYEQVSVTTVNPRWAAGNFTMTHVDGSAGTTDPDSPINWRRYRYRIYETVIPLRNVAWGTP